jgi:hypothetical protein
MNRGNSTLFLRQARRHADRVPRRTAPAINRQSDEVEIQELTELAGEFEPGLVATKVRGRRSPDRREEFAALNDLVADRRYVMLPAAAAKEIEVFLAGAVLCKEVAHVSTQLGLGAQRGRQIERATYAMFLWNLLEKFVNGIDAEFGHQPPFECRNRVRHVWMSARLAGHLGNLLGRCMPCAAYA